MARLDSPRPWDAPHFGPGVEARIDTSDAEVRVAGAPPMYDGFATSFIGSGLVRVDSAQGESFSNSAIVYRCFMTIASSLAALDLAVQGPDDELDKDHQVARLFNRGLGTVNGHTPPMSARVYREMVWLQKEFRGQAFTYVQRDGTETGEPTALRLIPWRVTPLVDEDQENLVGYWVDGPRGRYNLLPGEVLWDRYPHPTLPWGCLPPLHAATFAADLDDYMRVWQKSEMKNGARPAGVVFLGDLQQDQRDTIRAEFDARQTGPQNAGKHLFLSGLTPASYTRIGLTPAELDWVNSRSFGFDEIKLGLGVPVGMWKADQTYENQRSNENQLWTLTLIPKVDTSASEIDRQLIPDESETAVWDTSDVQALKENEDAVHTRVHQVTIIDLLTLDEARAEIGQPPLPGGVGEMTLSAYRAQFGFSPLGGAVGGGGSGKDMGAPVAQTEQQGARTSTMARFAEKQLRVVQRNIERRQKKGQPVTTADIFDRAYWDGVGEDMLDEDVDVRMLNAATELRIGLALERGHGVTQIFDELGLRTDLALGDRAERHRETRLAPVVEDGATRLRAVFRAQHELLLLGLGARIRASAQQLPDDIEEILGAFAVDANATDAAAQIHDAALRAAVQSAADDFSLDVSWDAINPKLSAVREALATRVTAIDDTTRDLLRAALLAGLEDGETFVQISARVADVMNSAVDYRSVLIARTESRAAYGLASATAYTEGGVTRVQLFDGTDDPACAARNGLIVTVEEAVQMMGQEHPNGTLGFAPVVDAA